MADLHIAPTARAALLAATYLRCMLMKKGMRSAILVVHLLASLVGLGQTDTEFWFVAPEVWAGHGDFPIVLRFSSFNAAATITVEQPANPAFPTQTLSLGANSVATLDLTPWMSMVENKPVNTVLGFGLHITSTADITAYYEVNHINNPDIFTLKGSGALGTEFYTPFQTFLNNNYTESMAGLDLVATEDNTSITVTPSAALAGHPAGVPFTITLDAGQTYSLRAASPLAAQHPAGTHITSSAPIAVTMSDDSIVGSPYGGTCFDLLGDQLIPVEVAGTEHIAVKGPNLNGPDKVFILATEDGTEVQVNGVVFTTLNAGQTYTHSLLANVAYYTTSAPVLVLHMTGVSCEVAGAVLPPLVCTGSQDVAFVRSTNQDFALTLLVQSGAEGGFAFNGNPAWIPAASFTVVPGSGGNWLYAQITATGFIPALGASRVTNALGRFHLGTINGLSSSYARYGYFSDFRTYHHVTSVDDDDVCAGEIVVLAAEPISGGTYEWTGPGSFTANASEVELGPLTVEDGGEYIVTGSVGECPIEADTLVLVVNPGPPAPSVTSTAPWCAGETATLTAAGVGDVWTWSGPTGLLGEGSNELEINESGAYEVTLTLNGCTSEPGFWEGEVVPPVALDLGGEPWAVCSGEDLSWEPPGLPEGTWQWSTPLGSVTEGPTLNLVAVTSEDAGWYVLSGTVEGCPVESDSVNVLVQTPTPLTPNVPPSACTGAPAFPLEIDDPWGGSWTGDCGACVSGGEFLPTEATPGAVSLFYVSDGACATEAEATLEVLETPDASFGAPLVACIGAGEVGLSPLNSGGTWEADCGGCMQADGVFDAGFAGVGIWSIAYTLGGICPNAATGSFEVTPNASSDFNLPNGACVNAPAFTPIADVAGGTWSASCTSCWNAGAFIPANAGSGPVEITYEIPGSCGSSTTQSMEIWGLPTADFSLSPASGCAPLWVDFMPESQPNAVSCAWTFQLNGVNASTFWGCEGGAYVFTDAGCYDIVHAVTDANGCVNTLDVPNAVCVSAPPSAEFTWSPAFPEWSNSEVVFEAVEVNAELSWAFNGGSVGSGPTWELVPAEAVTGTWSVCLTAMDAAECEATECVQIEPGTGLSVWAPNAFTPDGDQRNEAWRLVLGGDVVELQLDVFDRWGMLVFSTRELEHWWDGRVREGDYFAPNDVYLWQAIVRDVRGHARTASGHVTLIR